MEVVAMTEPLALTARRELARLVIANDDEVAAAKTFLPEKVLLSVRRVEDAPVTVIELPTVKLVPLIVPREPVRRLVPMEVVAMTRPEALVERMALVRLGCHSLPEIVRLVVEAFERVTVPLNRLCC
jgi:hypothetical protein